MGSFCARCGREADLLASTDGSMLCESCIILAKPHCVDCIKCHQRKCGDAIYACSFCHLGTEGDNQEFGRRAKERIAPLRIDERCERCGGTLPGRAFILHGKALCRDCLIYEQDRWEIVSARPGKGGTRIRVVFESPKKPNDAESARKLFHSIGVDPENLPPDPFSGARTMKEGRMPDDSCVNCEEYAEGKKRGKFLGRAEGDRKADAGGQRRD